MVVLMRIVMALVQVVDKLFKTHDGRIVVGQAPNAPAILWSFAAGVERFSPFAPLRAIGRFFGTVIGIYWALLEVSDGVNLFRRIMGGCVLCWLIWRAASKPIDARHK